MSFVRFQTWKEFISSVEKYFCPNNESQLGPKQYSHWTQLTFIVWTNKHWGILKKKYIFCPFKAPESYKQKHFWNSLFQSPKLTYIHTRYAVAWELSPAEAFSSSISPEPLFHTLSFSSGFCDLCRLPVISCYLCRSL